jgi:hypothetical protein
LVDYADEQEPPITQISQMLERLRGEAARVAREARR